MQMLGFHNSAAQIQTVKPMLILIALAITGTPGDARPSLSGTVPDCAWDKNDASCPSFEFADYVVGKLGDRECPPFSKRIPDGGAREDVYGFCRSRRLADGMKKSGVPSPQGYLFAGMKTEPIREWKEGTGKSTRMYGEWKEGTACIWETDPAACKGSPGYPWKQSCFRVDTKYGATAKLICEATPEYYYEKEKREEREREEREWRENGACEQQARFDVFMCKSHMCTGCTLDWCVKACQETQQDFPACRCKEWPEARASFMGGNFAGKGKFGDVGDYSESAVAFLSAEIKDED